MRKSWTDLVIINGRVPHLQTQALIEHDNRTLKMSLWRRMQHNHTDNWSKGKYRFLFKHFMTFNKIFLSNLYPVVYEINTSVAKATNKKPYEVVFRRALISNFELWKLISQSGVEDEENLPDNFRKLSRCKFYVKFNFVF